MSYQTEAMLRALVLEPCPICGVEGPKARLSEHLVVEHRIFERERGDVFMPRVPTRFRERLIALSELTGATPARLVAIALDDYYGCHPPNGDHAR